MSCGCCEPISYGDVRALMTGTVQEGMVSVDHAIAAFYSAAELAPDPGFGVPVEYAYTEVFNKHLIATDEIVGTTDGVQHSASVNSRRAWRGDGAGGMEQIQFADFDDPNWEFEEQTEGENPVEDELHYYTFKENRWDSGDWAVVGDVETGANPFGPTSGEFNATSISQEVYNNGVIFQRVRGPLEVTIVPNGSVTPVAENTESLYDCSGLNLGMVINVVNESTEVIVSRILLGGELASTTISLPDAPEPDGDGDYTSSYAVFSERRSLNHCRFLTTPAIL